MSSRPTSWKASTLSNYCTGKMTLPQSVKLDMDWPRLSLPSHADCFPVNFHHQIRPAAMLHYSSLHKITGYFKRLSLNFLWAQLRMGGREGGKRGGVNVCPRVTDPVVQSDPWAPVRPPSLVRDVGGRAVCQRGECASGWMDDVGRLAPACLGLAR